MVENKKKKGIIKKLILFFILIITLCTIATCAYVAYIIATEKQDIDPENIYTLTAQKTVIYDKNGDEITDISYIGGNRTILKYEEMPQNMKDAIVAIEDKTFWDHHGFNFIRILGAVKEKVIGGGKISGTSTITQQLARNVYLADTKSERTIQRKIMEAYYTAILEKELSKKEILEAYLNTVYFGYNSYGLETASENYFGKEAKDLTLAESAALAALPKAPDTYALIIATDRSTKSNLPIIAKTDNVKYLYNGDVSKDRRELCLSLMKSHGYITKSEKEEAINTSLKDSIKVNNKKTAGEYEYFTDYTISSVINDLCANTGLSEDEARRKVYSGGLKIYTSLDPKIQKILTSEIEDSSNYTNILTWNRDYDGNILNSKGKVILRPYSYYIRDGKLTINEDEAYMDGDNLIIKKGKRFRFNEASNGETTYIQVGFKPLYLEDGGFSIASSGHISLPAGYTELNSNGDCVISGKIFTDFPEIIEKGDSEFVIKSENCDLSSKMVQPQAAATIIDNKTGRVVAMCGGRGGKGSMIYNRATSPRQPGSSIKPIAVYGPALQYSANAVKKNEPIHLTNERGDDWGEYITAGSIINDTAMYVNGELWPRNAYSGFRGRMTLRTALQQSVNVCAVKIFNQLDTDYIIDMLQKNGITTIDQEGPTNDVNAAALALGGMTDGISSLELAAAYATFPNGGTYRTPVTYTKVCNSKDEIIIESPQENTRVYDEDVAWIMTDILQSVVTKGIASSAAIGTQPVGGKTGTTTDQYDIWFAGFTPQYTMALWEGTDINLKLAESSSAATRFWSSIMRKICDGMDRGEFFAMPESIDKINGEYYVRGTKEILQPVYTTEPATTDTDSDDTTKPATTDTDSDDDSETNKEKDVVENSNKQ